MKYIVIQGRMPQNGDVAKTALIMFPSWVSPTLVCAGVIGRVQELTDGGIIEQGEVPGGELEVLEVLRDEMEPRVEPAPATATLPNNDPHAADAAYREGMQAQRNSILGDMSRAGMPPDTRPVDWIIGLVAKLQAAEDNLDAWRDAAGRNPLIVQHTDSDTGRITALGVAKDTMTLELQLDTTQAVAQLEALQHDPLRLQEFGTLEDAQAAHDALADKYDEMHEMLIQRTTQRDALYATALNNLNTLRDK